MANVYIGDLATIFDKWNGRESRTSCKRRDYFDDAMGARPSRIARGCDAFFTAFTMIGLRSTVSSKYLSAATVCAVGVPSA